MGAFAGGKICCNHLPPPFKKDIEFKKNETKKDTNDTITVTVLDDLNNINTNTNKKSLRIENNKFTKTQTVHSSTSIQKYKNKSSSGRGVNNISIKDEQNLTTNDHNNNLSNTISKNINNESNIKNSTDDINNMNSNIKIELAKKTEKVSMQDLNIISDNNQKNNDEETGSKLLLSGELFFQKELIINIHGLKNSLRKKADNIVFFGLKECMDYKGNSFNDYIINYKSKYDEMGDEVMNSNTGRIFKIYFNKKLKEYMLYFMHSSLLLYYKINNFIYFDPGKDYFLILGSIFLTVYVEKNLTSTKDKIINILVELENEEPKRYTFNQNQTPITIGRLNCEVVIPKSSVSKHHSVIEFSNSLEMFYYKDLGSVNGSTLIIKEDDYLKIKGEMNFKLEDVPFKILEVS